MIPIEINNNVTEFPRESIKTRIAIFTLDSMYSNYALKNLTALLKGRVELIVCSKRLSNKSYGSYFHQAASILKKSGLSFVLYLNVYVFLYRFFLYLGIIYRRVLKKQAKAFPLDSLSRRYGFRLLQAADINSDDIVRELKKERINLIISIHLDQLIKEPILKCPALGAINVHYGDLPSNAGPFPTIWSILRGENSSIVTIHYMNSLFDQGDIIAQQGMAFHAGESILGMDCRLHKLGAKLLREVVLDIESQSVKSKPQELNAFCYRSYPSKLKLRLLKRRAVPLFYWHEFFNYFF